VATDLGANRPHHDLRPRPPLIEKTVAPRALDLGWQLLLADASPEDVPGLFAYVRSGSGLLVEFVSAEIRPAFEQSWREG
jgi:hypothetical protein